MSADNNPTVEQIRNARRSGFDNSVSNMADDRRTKLTESYYAQDTRREKNVGEFYNNVVGNKSEE